LFCSGLLSRFLAMSSSPSCACHSLLGEPSPPQKRIMSQACRLEKVVEKEIVIHSRDAPR
jgi:hypothetical protein